MKLPRNYFDNLSTSKYKEYLKLLPNMKKENTKAITMLIFTFFSLSFLGIFAINPTLSTIFELNKQVTDSEYVNQQLTTKMNNLSSLQLQYNDLTNDLPIIDNAIPENALAPHFAGQIEAIAKRSSIQIIYLRIADVILDDTKKKSAINSSFTFNMQAQGAYDDMLTFSSALTDFNRIVSIDSLSITKDPANNRLILGVQGKGYFKK